MMPAVPVPEGAGIRHPVELKLKPRCRYNSRARVFEPGAGDRFDPFADLPKDTRIEYKVPALADADPAKLSTSERDLSRYMQVILPEGATAADYLDTVRRWPCVEDAWLGPDVSLPKMQQ